MKLTPVVLFLMITSALVFAEQPISGKWYRNVPFAEATMTVDASLHFHIDASYAVNTGSLEGKLHRVKPDIYYSIIDDKALNQSCLVVMSVVGRHLIVSLYGDEVDAGAHVYFEGTYHPQPMSEAQFRRKALDSILPKGLSQRTVTDMLGTDLDYFIECFAVTTSIQPTDTNITHAYRGWLPGIANYENGILALGREHVYIAFLDTRGQKPKLQYYTNAPTGTPLPTTVARWVGKRHDIPLVRHYSNAPNPAR